MTNAAFEYAMTNKNQQQNTTKGSLFRAYNSVTGYFQNVRTYKNDEAKIKSLMFDGADQQKAQRAQITLMVIIVLQIYMYYLSNFKMLLGC